MSKETKTVVLPVKYQKTKRFIKSEITQVGLQKNLFMFGGEYDTVIFTKSGKEYYIDMPLELVKHITGVNKNE